MVRARPARLSGAVPWRPTGIPDWRDPAGYAALLDVARPGHAWEWLRRDAAYREAAGPAGSLAGEARRAGAAAWGLHDFEDVRNDALAARPIWRAEVHPYVLACAAEPGESGPDAAAIARLFGQAVAVEVGRVRHLLLSDGRRSLRIDVSGSWRAGDPLRLVWQVEGLFAAQVRVQLLRQLIGLARHGRFVRALHPPNRHARRLVLLLRAHDALVDNADQREIASVLLGGRAAAPRWRVDNPSLRSRAQRLVRGARALAAGGWRGLLR